MITVFVIYPIL